MIGLNITCLYEKFDDSSFSHSRDMVHANQILCRSYDLTMPFSGTVVIPGLVLASINLPTKLEASISTHYEDMKGDTRCQDWGGLR